MDCLILLSHFFTFLVVSHSSTFLNCFTFVVTFLDCFPLPHLDSFTYLVSFKVFFLHISKIVSVVWIVSRFSTFLDCFTFHISGWFHFFLLLTFLNCSTLISGLFLTSQYWMVSPFLIVQYFFTFLDCFTFLECFTFLHFSRLFHFFSSSHFSIVPH